MCKFGSLIVCISFYIQKYFPSIGNVLWEQDKPVTRKINEFITQLGDNFENTMNTYLDEFKLRMKRRIRIPKELVTKYYSDMHFLVDTNTFVQVDKPRKAWLQSFEYEVDSDVVSANIDALLKEEIDFKGKPFGRYEEENSRIIVKIKIASKEK